MTGTLPVHWKSQFVHLNIIIKAGAITEKQIYMVHGRGVGGEVCLFSLRNGGTNLSHMKSFYINLMGYFLS